MSLSVLCLLAFNPKPHFHRQAIEEFSMYELVRNCVPYFCTKENTVMGCLLKIVVHVVSAMHRH